MRWPGTLHHCRRPTKGELESGSLSSTQSDVRISGILELWWYSCSRPRLHRQLRDKYSACCTFVKTKMTFHYILWLDDKDFWLLNDSFSSRFWTVEWFATYLTKLILTLRTWTLTLPSILHYSLGHLPFYLFLLSLDSIHRWLPSCLAFRLNRWGVMSGWHNTHNKTDSTKL